MQDTKIRYGTPADLNEVSELEKLCFPRSEAADKETFRFRLNTYPQYFHVLEKNGHIVSMINGMSTNQKDLCDQMYENSELYDPDGEWLMLFGVATLPAYQKNGYASMLMKHIIKETTQHKRKGIVLTCKKELIGFYSRFGFVNEGISASEHGGAEWYQMRIVFHFN